MQLSDFQALSLFIKMAEVAGFITKEGSLKSQRQVRNTQNTVTMVQELVKSYGIKKEVAQSLWTIVKMAPAPKEDNNFISASQSYNSQISLNELPKELRNQICFSEELIRRKIVSLEEINKILERIQKENKKLSIGQLLLRKHLITPDQFIDINQQSISNAKKELQIKIMFNNRTNLYYIASGEIPSLMGRYEIIREIARGGMGVVYEARDIELDRIVALKTMIAGELADKTDMERFQRESKLAASFNHPNIVKIYEVGFHENNPYFTMDYIEGLPLSEYIRKTKLSLNKIISMMVEVADALAYAHGMGIIHRDIKPGNILVDTTGRALLTDFGLARQKSSNEGLTMSGVALGTPSYMPPEQAEGRIRDIDARSDIYSFGAVLYEILSGRPPFSGASLAETLHAVIHDDPIPIRQLVQGLHIDVETICMKCLEKNIKKRYPNAKTLIKDMERFLKGDAIRARRISFMERSKKWMSRNKITVVAMSLMALIFFIMIFSKISDVNEINRIKKEALEKISQIEKESEEKYKIKENLYQEIVNNIKKEKEKIRLLQEENIKLKLDLEKNKQNKVSNYNYVKLGLNYYNQGLFSKSIEYFTKAIEINPNDEKVFSFRAIAFMASGNSYDALKDLEKSIQIKPTSDAYGNKAAIFFKIKDYNKSKETFDIAIKKFPSEHTLYYNRSVLFEQLGKYYEAIEDLNKVILLAPSSYLPKAYAARASLYDKLKNYERALEDFERCLNFSKSEKFKLNVDKIMLRVMELKKILNKN